MKRILSVVLSISLLASCLVFLPTNSVLAETSGYNVSEVDNVLKVTDTKSFVYASTSLQSGVALTTQITKDKAFKQPLSNISTGWDGAFRINSTTGAITGPAAGKAQERIVLRWINRTLGFDNNTVMFYVELPDYKKAGADWGLSISTLYAQQDGTNFYMDTSKGIEYSYLSSKSDKWEYAVSNTVSGMKSVFSALPSGFKGYLRLDISSITFGAASGKYIDLSKYYMLIDLEMSYNGVGGVGGELVFGGVLYFPDEDKCDSTLLSSRSKYYYQLGRNSDAVIATASAPKYNVTIWKPSTSQSDCAFTETTANCASGENAIAINSTTGSVITTAHMYARQWPNLKMQPGVDTFMIYVELPNYTDSSPALNLAYPATKQNEGGMTYINPANAPYSYLSVDGTAWQKGVMGANGELSELGSGFKGYIKFDIKNFAFYTDNTSIKTTYDFTKTYNLEAIQLKFDHVGGQNGKLVIGPLYSVLQDSDSTVIKTVAANTATAEPMTSNSIKAVSETSPVLKTTAQNGQLYTALSQINTTDAAGVGTAYSISSKDGSLTGAVAQKPLENLVMQAVNLDFSGSNSLVFYTELPSFKASGADWALSLSSLKLTQNSRSFTARLDKRAKFSFLNVNSSEWQEGTIRDLDGANAVFTGLPSGFKGYICLNLTDFTYAKNGTYIFNQNSAYKLTELGFGLNSIGGECGQLVLGGGLYPLEEDDDLTCDMRLSGGYYRLTKNPNALVANVVPAGNNATADCVGATKNGAALLGGDTVTTELQTYGKSNANIPMFVGVDSFMAYIEMPEFSQNDTALYLFDTKLDINGSTYTLNLANGKYSYMSIFDGEWKTALIGQSGALSKIGSGFKGYVKFNIKDFDGYSAVKTAIAATDSYTISNISFAYKYAGGNNGKLLIGAFYGVAEDSYSVYIAIANKRRVTSTRFVYGDLLADGKINSGDITVARKALLGVDTIPESSDIRSDANLDGVKIDIRDLVLMKKVSLGKAVANIQKENADTSGLNISKWLENGQIPYYTEGTVTQMTSGDGTKVMTAVGTNVNTYKAYIKALEAVGFKLYTSNTVGKNLFATYTNESLTVNAYYIEGNKTARIIWEPLGALTGLKEENVYDTSVKVQTQLTGLDVDKKAAYIIRLEDNSFIIIDGGMADGKNGDSKKLYDQLVAQTPVGQKPVIAAWIFSHAHNDHIGNFVEFTLNYFQDVTVERIFCNFPGDHEIESSEPELLGTEFGYYGSFKKVLAEYYYNTPIIKVHTGNKFYVRNAEFEVLQTFEDFYPQQLSSHSVNSTSVVYKMLIGGQSTLWLGDAITPAENILVKQFGDYLKCDVLQLTHHGLDGTLNSYKTYNPTYCLWPAGTAELYNMGLNVEANRWLIYESENVKQTFVTGFGTYKVNLPINLKTTYGTHPYANNYKNPAFFE